MLVTVGPNIGSATDSFEQVKHIWMLRGLKLRVLGESSECRYQTSFILVQVLDLSHVPNEVPDTVSEVCDANVDSGWRLTSCFALASDRCTDIQCHL